MKSILRVPIAPYAYIEFEGTEKDLEKMEQLYNKYAETPINFGEKKKGLVKYDTFTGETVYYDDERHVYEDEHGNILLSGSAFKSLNEKPFDREKMCGMVGKKYGVEPQVIGEMWERSSRISTTFGTSLHLALEQWFRHKDTGTDKEYHITKNPILKSAIESFPLKDESLIPEVMVSDVARGMAGQIDALHLTGKKKCTLIDYKTDADIKKNLNGHFLQVSFYADILKAHGWKVEKIQIWNYTGKWECYDGEVLLDISQYKPFKQ